MFPAQPSYQALFIVCQFGVILGGLSNTAVYKPSFFGFALAVLVPLIVRVAIEGDQVHLFTAGVLGVVLVFVLAFGLRVNGVLTQSLATRYENVDLIRELQAQTKAALAARAAAETASLAKSQFLAAASHDLRQPLHAMGLFAAALASRVRDPGVTPLVASIRASVEALEHLFAELLDLSQLDAGALRPAPAAFPLQPLFVRLAADFGPQAEAARLSLRVATTRLAIVTDPVLLERVLRNLLANAVRYTRAGGIRPRRAAARRSRADRCDRHRHRHRRCGQGARLRGVRAARGRAAQTCGGTRNGIGPCDRAPARCALRSPGRARVGAGRGSRFSIAVPGCAPLVRVCRSPRARRRMEGLSANTLSGRRVVVVDDDPAVVAAMQALFASWDAKATGGPDASLALATLADDEGGDDAVDLIVADLRLADGNSGIDAIGTLRERLGVDTPAIVVSGDTSAAAEREARDAEVRLLLKPVVAAALKDAAERAMSSRAMSSRVTADRA
jgi:CheY-like chemotaxis protein